MTSAHYGHAPYASARAEVSDSETIKRFGHVVRRAAHHLSARTGVPADDLWSAGALGAIEAFRRYDPKRGVKLDTFIAHRVRGAMLDELRRMDRLPRRLRGRVAEVARARRQLAQTLGREPDQQEIAAHLGVEAATLDSVSAAAAAPVDIDDTKGLASESVGLELLVVNRQRAAELREAIAELPERQQLVLAMRYTEELSLKEIAGVLHVSEPRICQIHNAAVKKLREALTR